MEIHPLQSQSREHRLRHPREANALLAQWRAPLPEKGREAASS